MANRVRLMLLNWQQETQQQGRYKTEMAARALAKALTLNLLLRTSLWMWGRPNAMATSPKAPKPGMSTLARLLPSNWLYMACMRLTMSPLQAVLGLASPELADRVT